MLEKNETNTQLKMETQCAASIVITLLVFLGLYFFTYIFFGVTIGECGSSTRRLVGSSETILIAIASIVIGNTMAALWCWFRGRGKDEGS